ERVQVGPGEQVGGVGAGRGREQQFVGQPLRGRDGVGPVHGAMVPVPADHPRHAIPRQPGEERSFVATITPHPFTAVQVSGSGASSPAVANQLVPGCLFGRSSEPAGGSAGWAGAAGSTGSRGTAEAPEGSGSAGVAGVAGGAGSSGTAEAPESAGSAG